MKLYKLSDNTFYDCINTIYQFVKPFLETKMSVFEEYGAFKVIFKYSGISTNGRLSSTAIFLYQPLFLLFEVLGPVVRN